MLSGATIAVVVPAHNEGALIARTLRQVPAYVDAIVVVDDGSADDTAERAAAVDDPRVALVRHSQNRGVGAAILTGYRRAFSAGADVAAVMAGDAQMDPADLLALLGPVLAGDADYTKGDRLSHHEAAARIPPARFVGNHALSAATRLATGLPVQDSQCGYTALSRSGFEALSWSGLWPSYGYPNDLLSRAATARLRVRDVIVRPIYADEQSGIRARHLLTAFPYVLARGLLRRLTTRAQPTG